MKKSLLLILLLSFVANAKSPWLIYSGGYINQWAIDHDTLNAGIQPYKTIVFHGPVTFDPGVTTFPSDLTIKFTDEGRFMVNDGQTIVIKGPIEASMKKIFDCSGTGLVSFAGNIGIKEVYPQWWGAIANSPTFTENHTAINNTINSINISGNLKLIFPSGVYYLFKPIVIHLPTAVTSIEGVGSTTVLYLSKDASTTDFNLYPFLLGIIGDETHVQGSPGISISDLTLGVEGGNMVNMVDALRLTFITKAFISYIFAPWGFKNGIYYSNCDYITIQNCHLALCSDAGIKADGYTYNNMSRIINNAITGNKYAVRFDFGMGPLFQGNEIATAEGTVLNQKGIWIGSDEINNKSVVNPNIINNRFEGFLQNSIQLGTSSSNVQSGNIEGNVFLVNYNANVFDFPNAHGTSVKKNSIWKCQPDVVYSLVGSNPCNIEVVDNYGEISYTQSKHSVNIRNNIGTVSSAPCLDDIQVSRSTLWANNNGVYQCGWASNAYTGADNYLHYSLPGYCSEIRQSDGNLFFETAPHGNAGVSVTEISPKMVITNAGNVGIGTQDPKSKLHVTGLPEYVDNTDAINHGLTPGAFYRTGDLLKVAH